MGWVVRRNKWQTDHCNRRDNAAGAYPSCRLLRNRRIVGKMLVDPYPNFSELGFRKISVRGRGGAAPWWVLPPGIADCAGGEGGTMASRICICGDMSALLTHELREHIIETLPDYSACGPLSSGVLEHNIMTPGGMRRFHFDVSWA